MVDQAYVSHIKAMYVPFICCMRAWSVPMGCRVTDKNVEGCWLTPEHSKTMQKLGSLHLA